VRFSERIHGLGDENDYTEAIDPLRNRLSCRLDLPKFSNNPLL
jgi:hypothetical protein